jgi:hypothetical protein
MVTKKGHVKLHVCPCSFECFNDNYEVYKQWTTSLVYTQGNELQNELMIETDTDWYLQTTDWCLYTNPTSIICICPFC